ncbi:MAG: ParB/RepB/Spo0J family partition protein [Synergistetes bacterium]|nr:ParB/RepB/Spo0J family partition protein [Synergistota bacterium]MDW8191759.1 ParB/RepB/Spo0J family partition protein [Synergistota bacterium]
MPLKPTRGGLGKGLGALIPTGPEKERLIEIPIEEIVPNPYQPRKILAEESLEELANSIKQHGLLQPIIVRKVDRGYEIVAGERRYRAAQRAGFQKIPAIVKDISDEESMEYALIENLQREDLNPIEAANALKLLMERFGLTQEEVADKIGKDRSTVANLLRLLRLPEELQNMVSEGRLTMGHARALLSLNDPEEQKRLALEVVNRSLTVREVEREVSRRVKGIERDREIERRFLETYNAKVRVKRGVKNSVELLFDSESEMEDFLQKLERLLSQDSKLPGQ